MGVKLLSAPVADAGVLAVSDRVDGTGSDDGHLSGPLHSLSRASRDGAGLGSQGLGVLRGRGDGRARIDGRPHDAGARKARQFGVRRSTAICSASTVRCAATARSSRNWRPRFSAPAGTSSRSSGVRAGTGCWRATMRACCAKSWSSASMASIRISRPRAAPTPARISSARIRGSRKWSPTCPMRTSGASTVAGTMPARCTRPTPRPCRRAADRP